MKLDSAIFSASPMDVRRREWLGAALGMAAQKAGYERWPHVGEISEVVSQYLAHPESQQPADIHDLDRIVRTTLRQVGYPDVASRFKFSLVSQSSSLLTFVPDCSLKPGETFFRRLSADIKRIRQCGVKHCNYFDLDRAAEELAGEGELQPGWLQAVLSERIVEFIREKMVERSNGGGDVLCTVTR